MKGRKNERKYEWKKMKKRKGRDGEEQHER
jgi:hypothetical protein